MLPPTAGWNSLIQDPDPKPVPPMPPYPDTNGRIQSRPVSPSRITGEFPVDMDFDEHNMPWRHWQPSPIAWVTGPMPAIDHRQPQAPLQPGELTPRQRHRIALRKEQQWRDMLRKEMAKKDKAERERREAIQRARAYQEELIREARRAREFQEKEAQGEQAGSPIRDPDAEPQKPHWAPPPRVRFEFPQPDEQGEGSKGFARPRYTHTPGPGESPRCIPCSSRAPIPTANEEPFGQMSSSETQGRDLAPDSPPPMPPILYYAAEGQFMSAPARDTCEDEENPAMPPYALVKGRLSTSMPTMSIGPVSFKDDEEPPSLVPSLSMGGSSIHSLDSNAIESEEEEEEAVVEDKGKGKGKAKDQTVHFAPKVESISDEELPGHMRRGQGKPKVVPFYLGADSIDTAMKKEG
ncbi:hypothetical protein FHL15_002697 [Xylaria flabelliformis]|uniref:Uncharacterized protein n=1 Tax=Xylaria flabelliformis TaxID=2512241 RepID=A0A553I8A4_9PEZI|nr:hypothetical protein FHL15_002697 [Xylaria flabelliformis]